MTGKHCDFDIHDRLAIYMFLIKAIIADRTEKTTKKDYLMKNVAQFPPKGCEILIFFCYIRKPFCLCLPSELNRAP